LRIPEIRDRLRILAVHHNDPELAELAEELKRRKRAQKTRAKAKPMTKEKAKAICAYKKAYPNKSQVEIGALFDVNPGRVSEALHGKRT
jgi:DNA integrity scanning protein DisA with diadenylate cyclase activity